MNAKLKGKKKKKVSVQEAKGLKELLRPCNLIPG